MKKDGTLEIVRSDGAMPLYIDDEGRVWLGGEPLSGVRACTIRQIDEETAEAEIDTSGVVYPESADEWRESRGYL